MRIPERIGRFVVEAELGRGGMGAVYRALDPELGRSVAIKVLLDEGSLRRRKRFLREAEALIRVSHPHVVRLLSMGEGEGGAPYLVRAWVEG